MATKDFMPVLFMVLFGFVTFNIVVNFLLLVLQKKRIYKVLSVFWPSVLMVFLLQSKYQVDPFSIALTYSATFVPMTVFSMIGFEAIGRKFPLRQYMMFYALTYPLFYLLYNMGTDFSVYAMPFCVATAAPLVHTFIYLLIVDRDRTTKLQKLLGCLFMIMPIHCINFALFRMVEGAQLWGWLVAYALYDALAVLLPSIALEEANLHENVRLQRLVNERTSKLSQTLKDNEGLLRVLLHDIANPLMVMKHFLGKITPKNGEDVAMAKISKSIDALEDILTQVKNRYNQKNNNGPRLDLKPVSLDECFKEVSFMFAQSLERKRISLKFNNELKGSTKVLAEKASLTHSVLSNLVSNGLKFSSPDTEIHITAKEDTGGVVLEVRDSGPGIPQEVIDSLMTDTQVASSEGTNGESGNGFGLSIVKSYVESYGGEIRFESPHLAPYYPGRGTNVQITLDRA
jgi:signal transduction histidine kinase